MASFTPKKNGSKAKPKLGAMGKAVTLAEPPKDSGLEVHKKKSGCALRQQGISGRVNGGFQFTRIYPNFECF